jgi:transposase InsO family protein
MPITACDLLHDRVLPFYEQLGLTVGAVLTDNGREFCGKPESHPYELLLAVEGIQHRTTKVRCPRTNGFVERMNRTLLDECFRVQGRTKWYAAPEEIQRDLDVFMASTTSTAPTRATDSEAGRRHRLSWT